VPNVISYDVEIDGTIVAGITNTSYIHTALTPRTQHSYKVRAITGSGESGWSNLIRASTLPTAPSTPINVTASSTASSILISWDKMDNDTEYEIEIDGLIVRAGMRTQYLHNNLVPESNHTYRVRARNISGRSVWSEVLTIHAKDSVRTYEMQLTDGKVFNLILTASDITNPTQYTYTVKYNAEELEVIDLCAETSRNDVAIGNIIGSDIQIVQYTPGTIVFKKLGNSLGDINSIKFKSKSDQIIQVIYSYE
jgi:hypothetical protein